MVRSPSWLARQRLAGDSRTEVTCIARLCVSAPRRPHQTCPCPSPSRANFPVHTKLANPLSFFPPPPPPPTYYLRQSKLSTCSSHTHRESIKSQVHLFFSASSLSDAPPSSFSQLLDSAWPSHSNLINVLPPLILTFISTSTLTSTLPADLISQTSLPCPTRPRRDSPCLPKIRVAP